MFFQSSQFEAIGLAFFESGKVTTQSKILLLPPDASGSWIRTLEPLDNKSMEQHALQNVNTCLNTNIYFYLKTFGGQSYNLYLIVV